LPAKKAIHPMITNPIQIAKNVNIAAEKYFLSCSIFFKKLLFSLDIVIFPMYIIIESLGKKGLENHYNHNKVRYIIVIIISIGIGNT
jgi:hypothetical protein